MKRLSPLLLIFALLVPAMATAQEQVGFSTLNVDLWPEYDRPEMLVIYRATLSTQTSFPVEVNFRIPMAGEVHAVAVGSAPNTVADVPYNRQISGAWAQVSFTAALPVIHFEYYDSALTKEGIQRQFEYQWPGDYRVDSFTMRVQQPVGAQALRLLPDTGSPAQGEDGFLYQIVDVGPLAAGNMFTIRVEYQKETDALSVETLAIQPSGPVSQESPGRFDVEQVVARVLGFLGVALIFGGGYWYWRSRRAETSSNSRRKRKTARLKTAEDETGVEVYCHQCGKRAAPNDRFCRSCGTRLRAE